MNMSNPGCFIADKWMEGSGIPLRWTSPTDGQITWDGRAADQNQIDAAVASARAAQAEWSRRPPGERISRIEAFTANLQKRSTRLIDAICRETGKPQWEAATEVDAMIRKGPISIAAFLERRQPTEAEKAGETAATRYKPHGVVAVFGPFNLPGHLPNGHIIPALLAGNTVVFKPSEQSPLVGELTARAWEAAGLPPGVMNLIQGGRDAGIELSSHPGLDGLYFTGSYPVGQSLSRAFAADPGKILALEMGGNNPLIVWQAKDLDAAAYLTIVSAFITSGQRCSCTGG